MLSRKDARTTTQTNADVFVDGQRVDDEGVWLTKTVCTMIVRIYIILWTAARRWTAVH